MSDKLNINPGRGLTFRPRTEFTNEGEYLHQFLYLARPKLTKKLFLQLPVGMYLEGNCCGLNGDGLQLVTSPANERAAQWKSIDPSHRQRLCMIYRNKAHYEAMLEEGRRIREQNRQKSVVPFDPFEL